jgi:hypothetical protein
MIDKALRLGEINEHQVVDLYDSLSYILQDSDYQRLALYLPFEILPDKMWHTDIVEMNDSINRFRVAYLNAWYNLLNVQDMRANFVDGDVLEYEARPSDPPRVVKAAHLIPWLVLRGIIDIDEVSVLMNINEPILQRSISDTLPVLDNLGLLTAEQRGKLYQIRDSLLSEDSQEPLFISESRKRWLETRYLDDGVERPDKYVNIADLPILSGPFVNNMQGLKNEINDIGDKLLSVASAIGAYPVALLGGSRLKGYGDVKSDIDVCIFIKKNISKAEEAYIDSQLNNYNLSKIKLDDNDELIEPKERWAHELFDTAWIGEEKSITNLRHKLISEYFYEKDPVIRARCIERIEQDLLQYRLMHKGYPKHYPSYNDRIPGDQEIDGQSAFYDPGYRQIATKLFVGKVFIPKI